MRYRLSTRVFLRRDLRLRANYFANFAFQDTT